MWLIVITSVIACTTCLQAILVTHTLTHFHPQFCNDVVLGRFPASLERLLKLAALRVQFLEGNYKLGATM